MIRFIFSNASLTYELELGAGLGYPYPSLGKFLKGNSTDLLNKINGLFSLIPECRTYMEPMAGAGIAAGLVKQMYNPRMRLNDLNPRCADMLWKKFHNAHVTNDDAQSPEFWKKQKKADVVFLDNSSMTLRRVDYCMENAVTKARKTFVYTDTFPFSIIPFNEERLKGYLKEVEGWMRERNMMVRSAYLYDNHRAMIIRADRISQDHVLGKDIPLIEATDPFTFEKREGLFQ